MQVTFEEAKNSGKPFNRPKYLDGWYVVDFRGYITHYRDLSIRNPPFTEKDKQAKDWVIKNE